MKKNLLVSFSFVCMFLFLTNQTLAKDITVKPIGKDKTDTLNLQKAINENTYIALVNGGTYIIDKPLIADHSIYLTVPNGGSATIIQKNEKASAFYFQNENKIQTTVTKHVNKGQNFIYVANPKSISPNDIIEIKSKKLLPWDNRGYLTYGEMHQVDRVSGSIVYFKEKIDDNYNTFDVTVKVYLPKTLLLSNITFTHPKPTKTVMIKTEPTINTSIYNIKVYNSKVTGLLLKKSINTKVSNSTFNLGTTKDITSGYGVQDYGGRGTIVEKSIFTNLRRGVDFSGDIPSIYGIARNNSAYGPVKDTLAVGNSGFGTHSSAKYIRFENNYIENFNHAFVLRGTEVSVINNTSKGYEKSFVSLGDGNRFYVRNNHYLPIKNSILDYFMIKTGAFNGSVLTSNNQAVYKKWSNR